MLIDVICALASIVLLCAAMATSPQRARCPAGWYVNGIRPSGDFECRADPSGDPDNDGAGGHPDRTIDEPGRLRGRLYCTNGMHPIVVSDRVVGCQR